ncbi:hypothetical protein GGF46_004535 [Coemansia sp. RSA 552]|nr:hypothetical protein GGF46_004535 [Coemansia sp. RSA 552]
MTLGRVAALALFSGSVSATGNAIAQSLDLWSADADGSTESSERVRGTGYDPAQTLRFFVYGVAFAPVSFRWHAFLNSRFPLGAASIVKAVPGTATGASAFVARFQTSKAAAVLKRIAVDQAVFAPLASGTFVVGMGILEGLGPEELLERMRTYYLRILLAGYLVWPAAQLINFSVVPLLDQRPHETGATQ